jgi:hypothetical protein
MPHDHATALGSHSAGAPARSPFDLADPDTYRRWRAAKLEGYPCRAEALIVPVRDPFHLSEGERRALLGRLRKTNMAIYATDPGCGPDKALVWALGRQFGLHELDGNLCADGDRISALEVRKEGRKGEYIPYSNHRLNWHTDGYYNAPGRRVRGFVLHCVRPAAEGGENTLLDPEIAYIMLRDQDPGHIRALMRADAMTIPPNVEDGIELRPSQSGPVFMVGDTGNLYMRYTARGRNIHWRPDPATRAAVQALGTLLDEDLPHMFGLRLAPGQGLLCNNVLHRRARFTDTPGQGRLMYRARYYNRISGTELAASWR